MLFVKVSGGLLLIQGAALGPLVAALLMDSYGPDGFFKLISAMHALFCIVIICQRLKAGRLIRPHLAGVENDAIDLRIGGAIGQSGLLAGIRVEDRRLLHAV